MVQLPPETVVAVPGPCSRAQRAQRPRPTLPCPYDDGMREEPVSPLAQCSRGSTIHTHGPRFNSPCRSALVFKFKSRHYLHPKQRACSCERETDEG